MAGPGYATTWLLVLAGDLRRAARRAVSRWHLLVACLAYYGLMVLTGVVGMVDPSLAISTLTGSGYLVYAVGMIGAGATGVYAVLAGHRRAETWCLFTIAGLTLLHGIMLIAAGEAGYVSGTRLLAGTFGCYLIAFYRSQTAYTRSDLRRQIAAVKRAESASRSTDLPGEGGQHS